MKKLLVLLSAVAFVVAFTVPAMAADWGFYGSARMQTFMESDSKEITGTNFEDDDLAWALQGNSRIGANVKAGAISGRFEYGSTPNLRLLYGVWNFGGGALTVGQIYTPVFSIYSNQVGGGDGDLVTYGAIYAGRQPAVQVSMGGLSIALVAPNAPGGTLPVAVAESWTPTAADTNTLVPATAGFAAVETDTSIPKIEVAYSFKAGPVSLKPMFGYNTYEETVSATDKSYDIASYVLGLGFNVGLGAAYIKGDIYTGENLGQYGFAELPINDATYDTASDSIKDCDSMGYNIIAGFKASDMITIEAGYGSVETDLDMTGTYEDDASSYYVNATINLAKGCFIVPEIGKFDRGDVQWGTATKTKEGDVTYYGAKWQINF